MARVFVSHSSKDAAVAQLVLRWLRDETTRSSSTRT